MAIDCLKLGLPVALLLWLALKPARGWLAYVVQASSIGAVLLALALAVMWLVPPWPTPLVLALAFVAIVALRLRAVRRAAAPAWAAGRAATGALGVLALLGAMAICVSAAALLGRIPPQSDVARISSPIPAGRFLVASGGSNLWVNAHVRTLDESVPRYLDWRGQSHGIDIIKIDALGRRANGWQPASAESYLSFGTPLIAPCAGVVVATVDGLPDLPIGEQDTVNKAGNLVMIDCGGFVVALGHMKSGSVRVRIGERLESGTPIGLIGNSGQSSEPHLHIHAQRSLGQGNPFASEPMPLVIDGRYLVRNDRFTKGRP